MRERERQVSHLTDFLKYQNCSFTGIKPTVLPRDLLPTNTLIGRDLCESHICYIPALNTSHCQRQTNRKLHSVNSGGRSDQHPRTSYGTDKWINMTKSKDKRQPTWYVMCMHKLTGLCGSLGLPTLRPGCTLRRRSSHNPLRLFCFISWRKDLVEETGHRDASLLHTEYLALIVISNTILFVHTRTNLVVLATFHPKTSFITCINKNCFLHSW